jgi:hypothetical protein
MSRLRLATAHRAAAAKRLPGYRKDATWSTAHCPKVPAIALWSGNTLLHFSNWTCARTHELDLAAGNLFVHCLDCDHVGCRAPASPGTGTDVHFVAAMVGPAAMIWLLMSARSESVTS